VELENKKGDQHSVLFFDGVCGLCNGIVDFILKWDRKKKFLFSPLQSDYAQRVLDPRLTLDLATLVVRKENQTFVRSEAVFEILKVLGGFWTLGLILQIFPRRLLDGLYDRLARRRYQWFGQSATCRVPTPEERSRFL
jgi:predicted DCC family thiol-disulfide oxidoreductase YuxK